MKQLDKMFRANRFGRIYGGPFRECAAARNDAPVGTAFIKQAIEQQFPATCSVDTHDFKTPPSQQDMKYAMIVATQAMADGFDVYTGCAGGVGRTGVFMSLMVAALHPKVRDPIAFVRANYNSHAVETPAQRAWVDLFIRQNQSFFRTLRSVLHGAAKKSRRPTKRGKVKKAAPVKLKAVG